MPPSSEASARVDKRWVLALGAAAAVLLVGVVVLAVLYGLQRDKGVPCPDMPLVQPSLAGGLGVPQSTNSLYGALTGVDVTGVKAQGLDLKALGPDQPAHTGATVPRGAVQNPSVPSLPATGRKQVWLGPGGMPAELFGRVLRQDEVYLGDDPRETPGSSFYDPTAAARQVDAPGVSPGAPVSSVAGVAGGSGTGRSGYPGDIIPVSTSKKATGMTTSQMQDAAAKLLAPISDLDALSTGGFRGSSGVGTTGALGGGGGGGGTGGQPGAGVVPGSSGGHAQPQATTGIQETTASEVQRMIDLPPPQVIVVVLVKESCPGCRMMKEVLARLLGANAVDPARLRLLSTDQWMGTPLQAVMPATTVPQVFKVGGGKVTRGADKAPTDDEAVASMIHFVNSPH